MCRNLEDITNTKQYLAKATGLALLVGIYWFSDRKHNKYESFESHPVDQVFRNYDGVSLFYSDAKGLVHEMIYSGSLKEIESIIEEVPQEISGKFKYLEGKAKNGPYIIKDLAERERGYANILVYDYIRASNVDIRKTCIEVHLPRNQNISLGNEVFGGKLRIEAEMNEVK